MHFGFHSTEWYQDPSPRAASSITLIPTPSTKTHRFTGKWFAEPSRSDSACMCSARPLHPIRGITAGLGGASIGTAYKNSYITRRCIRCRPFQLLWFECNITSFTTRSTGGVARFCQGCAGGVAPRKRRVPELSRKA